MTTPSFPPGHLGPFAGVNVPWLLKMQARQRRDHPFITWAPFEGDARVWTYGEFDNRVGALAAGLLKRGLKPGDTLLIHLENCVEFLFAWFACAEIGVVAVTTNARAAAGELAYFADHSRAVAAITQPSLAGMLSEACPQLSWIAVTSHNVGAAPEVQDFPAKSEAFERLFQEDSQRSSRPADPYESCSIQFTSGTTARPKAVVWSHANALWGAKINAQHEGLRADDVHLVYLPLFHTNALSYSMLATLWAGSSAVLMPRFSASRFWDYAIRYRCTWGSMISFSTRVLMEQDVPPNHHFRMWSAPISDPPAFDKFGIKTIGWWGMTETISHGIVGDFNHVTRPMGIGRAAPEYNIRVVDDDGAPTKVGEAGNLLVRGLPGLSLFKEYLHNPEAMQSSFDEYGYFITGDRVQVLEEGVLRFTDRAKNLIRVGGENVAASEIEQIAMGVKGVREVAVVGKSHPMLDEVPVMFVIPVDGVEASSPQLVENVMEACRRNLAEFKVPREVRLMDEFPRATLEKVAKNELIKLL